MTTKSMKAKAKIDFETRVNFGQRTAKIKQGDILDVVLDKDSATGDGEIRLNGDYICDLNSPKASDNFEIFDENAVDAPAETAESAKANELENLPAIRSKNGIAVKMDYDDYAWLIAQAKQAQEYKQWLEKIADMSPDKHSAVDASYWALLALDRV